jgi:predicted DNA-binding transcriptional regulator AlpA
VRFGDFIDKQSFCRELGINPRTADRWARLRTGPPRVKAGKKVLYRRAAVLEWLQRQEATSNPAPGRRGRR